MTKRGNTNALKHGLYSRAKRKTKAPTPKQKTREPAKIETTIIVLEAVLDAILKRMQKADDREFAALANAIAHCSTAIFNGHRTIAFVSGKVVPISLALAELDNLEFEED